MHKLYIVAQQIFRRYQIQSTTMGYNIDFSFLTFKSINYVIITKTIGTLSFTVIQIKLYFPIFISFS